MLVTYGAKEDEDANLEQQQSIGVVVDMVEVADSIKVSLNTVVGLTAP